MRPTQAYEAILAYLVHNGWYFVVEMNSGKMVLPYFDALSAFWPGLQVPPSSVCLFVAGVATPFKVAVCC